MILHDFPVLLRHIPEFDSVIGLFKSVIGLLKCQSVYIGTHLTDSNENNVGNLFFFSSSKKTGHGYGLAAEWWSFGALAYDMLVGAPPFLVRALNRHTMSYPCYQLCVEVSITRSEMASRCSLGSSVSQPFEPPS